MRTSEALLIAPHWELLHVTMGEISILCEEAPCKPAMPMAATVMGTHEGAHLNITSVFAEDLGRMGCQQIGGSQLLLSFSLLQSEMSVFWETPNLTCRHTCVAEQVLIDLVFAQRLLTFSRIAMRRPRV